jgi:hypothetical protein
MPIDRELLEGSALSKLSKEAHFFLRGSIGLRRSRGASSATPRKKKRVYISV